MAWSLLTHTAVAGSSSTATTSAIDTTGATLIVVAYSGSLVVTPTDSQSNKNWYTPTKQVSGVPFGLSISFIVNPTTSASHTFTATGGGSFPALAVAAFSGTFGGAEKMTSVYTPSSNTAQPGSITPSTNDALLVAAYSNNSGTGTNTIDSGFTVADTVPGGANGGPIALAYLIQTTATAKNPTWTTTGAGVNSLAQMVSFLLGSGGGGGGSSTGGSYGFA